MEARDRVRHDHSSNGSNHDLIRRLHRKMPFDARLQRRWHGEFEGLKGGERKWPGHGLRRRAEAGRLLEGGDLHAPARQFPHLRPDVRKGWRKVIGPDRVTVREVLERTTRTCTPPGMPFGAAPKPELAHLDCREALFAVAGHGGAIKGRRLGQRLLAHRDGVVDGRTIVRAGLSGGSMTWQLTDVAPAAGAA